MKLFITGATGFVGRNLLFWLLKHQPEAHILGLTRDAAKANLLLQHPRLTWIVGDLNDPEAYRAAARSADRVIHAGALVKLRNGPEFYAQNVDATQHLLQAVADSPHLKRFVFVGSISAYDRPWTSDGHIEVNSPLREDSPRLPRTDYGKSKLQAQELVENSGLPYAIAIPPYIYGPYPRLNSSMDRLIHDVAAQKPYTGIPFPGRVSEIYSEDLAEVLWLLATHPKAENEAFFVANPDAIRVGEAFASVSNALGVPHKPRNLTQSTLGRLQSFLYHQQPESPMLRILFEDYFWCDAGKLFRTLGYQPRHGQACGIERTVQWYREQGLL